MPVETLDWKGGLEDGYLELVEQTLLPVEFRMIQCHTVQDVWDAIKRLDVRGAPAIGCAGAYGMAIGCRTIEETEPEAFLPVLDKVADYLCGSRPTAVNLSWAIRRITRKARNMADTASVAEIKQEILAEARRIHAEDRKICRAMGQAGRDLITEGSNVLTHCNAGALATADYGTALAVMFAAHEAGVSFHVFADETRPLLQGARLTAWELQQAGIPVTLICDNMAAQVMREGKVQVVITGADRIAANGDAANKIGTYGLSVLARFHKIPFYIVAPESTFDFSLEHGSGIPIETRDPREITHGFGKQTAPEGVDVYNPAFDVTPAEHITGIVTEHGIIHSPSAQAVKTFFSALKK